MNVFRHLALCAALLASSATHASGSELLARYSVVPNTVYHKASGVDLKLDLYVPKRRIAELDGIAHPVLIFFHGGGWVGGSKERSALHVLPYLEKGWAAVNVQYRLAGTALAPAAVQDARCALLWVVRNADRYGFDAERVVLSGRSAGGHLALITGMLTADAGFDNLCPGYSNSTGPDRGRLVQDTPQVAAIINWAGITDVNDLLQGANATSYAVAWLGGQPQWEEIARQVSPLTWVREDLPPILTLHGELDQVVPYDQAVRLHTALDEAGAANQLHTVTGREHFVDFTENDYKTGHEVIDAFLLKNMF